MVILTQSRAVSLRSFCKKSYLNFKRLVKPTAVDYEALILCPTALHWNYIQVLEALKKHRSGTCGIRNISAQLIPGPMYQAAYHPSNIMQFYSVIPLFARSYTDLFAIYGFKNRILKLTVTYWEQ